jgi:hypothetical protein
MKMAFFLFMMFHWASDLNPTFVLARKLRNRGHNIHYFGIRVRIAAYKIGVPITFSGTLISVKDSAVPPFNTNLITEDHADPATHAACAGMN